MRLALVTLELQQCLELLAVPNIFYNLAGKDNPKVFF